jgi:Protein of unknown function (DUF2510)
MAEEGEPRQAPAGWYDDPHGGGGKRYWDGGRWTEQTQPAQPSSAAVEPRQAPAGWYDDPHGGGGKRYWDGGRWTEQTQPAEASSAAERRGPAAGGGPAQAGQRLTGPQTGRTRSWPMRLFGPRPEVKAAREQRDQLLSQIAATEGDASQLLARLPAITQAADLKPQMVREANAAALRAVAQRALADEQLTVDEERHFLQVVEGLGFTSEDLQDQFRSEMRLLAVGRANDGRLQVIEEPHVMVKPGEAVHVELEAALTKRVAQREFRGGSAGLSFRVAKGVSLRTGNFRGRSVVVGTTIENIDYGILGITSKRTLFSGSQKTVECRHDKLVGLQVYSDAISINVSNRQNASMFRVEDGPWVAAMINAAAQPEI